MSLLVLQAYLKLIHFDLYLTRGDFQALYNKVRNYRIGKRAPRDQLVRPGQRRSLMRRALAGIVPEELLNRKRKAYVSRSPVATILSDRAALTDLANNMLSATMGIISPKAFLEAIQLACQGLEIPVVTLMRALAVELWLRNLSTHQVWNGFSSWNEQTVGQVHPRLASHVA